jgi:hypothetical protein
VRRAPEMAGELGRPHGVATGPAYKDAVLRHEDEAGYRGRAPLGVRDVLRATALGVHGRISAPLSATAERRRCPGVDG